MQKVSKALTNVACKVLWIGFGVQIVLGLCWMITNMRYVQQFGETERYLEASKSIIGNGYRGILYPILIMITQGMEQLVRIPYHCFLYLLQLVIGFWAARCLLEAVGIKGKCCLIYGSLAMLTVPMAMQCHLAVLPDSLGASFWLLEWACVIRRLQEQKLSKVTTIIKLCAFYVFGVCLLPEIRVTGALPVLVILVWEAIKLWKYNKKRVILRLAAFAFFFFCGVSVLAHVGEVEQRSTGSVMASRFGWSHVIEDYGYWPEEIREYIPKDSVNPIAGYADNMDRIVVKNLVDNVGEERAEALLLSMAKISFGRHTKENVKEILWDLYGYGFAPWVLQEQLSGNGYEAYSGRNYEIMGMHTPGLAGYYMNYGSCFFVICVFLAAVLQLCKCITGDRKRAEGEVVCRKLVGRYVVIILLLGALIPVLYYSMQGAGMMDYKKTLGVTLLWMVWVWKSNQGTKQ